MSNYGDVTLNLPPDWSRSRLVGGDDYLLTTVGHENGIADAFLTDAPNQEHQFAWLAPEDQNKVSQMRSKHYAACNKATWSKNPNLWEFDGEGRLVHNGQHLYARDRMYYDEQKRKEAEEETLADRNERSTSRAEDVLEQRGATITREDNRGRPLRPLSPQKQQRT